jgi:transcriptional regulator with XRE-family HTH domain
MNDDKADERRAAEIGRDLHRLRRLRGRSLADTAAATGLDADSLERVEAGHAPISVADLQRVARLFDVPLSWFFINALGPIEERGHIVRAASRRLVGDGDQGLVEELLSPDLAGSFEVFRSVFEPGAEMAEAQRRNTEDAGYVAAGELELWLDDRHFRLREGDSFRFSGERYRWRNPGADRAVVIWVISPPIY